MSPLCEADHEITEILVRCNKDATIFISAGQHPVVLLGGTDVGSRYDIKSISP
jgi:hypothetical protein